MAAVDVAAFYRAKADVGIELGASFRTLRRVWSGPGEAVAEVAFPDELGRNGLAVHPLLLDGCFQVMAAAWSDAGAVRATYLPFGWQRLWLRGPLPDRLICHLCMSGPAPASEPAGTGGEPEVLTADVLIYDEGGNLAGELRGYLVKRATRAALLAAVEGVQELLYEVVWRDRALPPSVPVGRVSTVAGNRDGGLAFVHGLPGGGKGSRPATGPR